MTNMQLALKKAGASVPLTKRVWLWLKDHPGKTAAEIAVALGEARAGHVSNALFGLKSRGMVSAENAQARSRYNRGVCVYTALGKEYELLPVRNFSAPPAKHFANTPVPEAAKLPAEKPVGEFAINVENMTLADARVLYAQLKEIFG
jgi:hypothetical protein